MEFDRKDYELAQKLDEFAYDYDPYEYMDCVEDQESSVRDIYDTLRAEDTQMLDGIISFLEDAVMEDNLYGADALLKEVRARRSVRK